MKRQNYSFTNVSVPVTFKNIDFVVYIDSFGYWPGFPITYLEPSEPSDIEFTEFHVELDGKIEDITESDMNLISKMSSDNNELFWDMLEDDEINEKVCVAVDDYVDKKSDERWY